MNARPIKTKPIKAKLFRIVIPLDDVRRKELLIRAKTENGAIAFAARYMMECSLCDQEDLVRLTKAGVEAVDSLDPDPDLFGERRVRRTPDVGLDAADRAALAASDYLSGDDVSDIVKLADERAA